MQWRSFGEPGVGGCKLPRAPSSALYLHSFTSECCEKQKGSPPCSLQTLLEGGSGGRGGYTLPYVVVTCSV